MFTYAASRSIPCAKLLWRTSFQVVAWPIEYRREAASLGLAFPKGILLHGPPGTGKTSAVLQVVRETAAALHRIDPGDVIGSMLGESERRLRERFAEARAAAAGDPSRPVVIFLDEADALCAKRSAQRAHEGRIVGQLLTLMDGAELHDLGRLRLKFVVCHSFFLIGRPSLDKHASMSACW